MTVKQLMAKLARVDPSARVYLDTRVVWHQLGQVEEGTMTDRRGGRTKTYPTLRLVAKQGWRFPDEHSERGGRRR